MGTACLRRPLCHLTAKRVTPVSDELPPSAPSLSLQPDAAAPLPVGAVADRLLVPIQKTVEGANTAREQLPGAAILVKGSFVLDGLSEYAVNATQGKVGDSAQVAQVRAIRFDDGPERGTGALDVRMAGGIHALVLTDRGMDLGPVWYQGHPLGWVSGTGPVHPAFGNDLNWLRLFHGGLLVTAGLENVGLPSNDQGVAHGLHGRISMTPARNVHWKLVPGEPGAVEVVGTMREVSVHGTDMDLTRTYRFRPGTASFSIHDVLTNRGFADAPVFLLYHFNVGYPVVDDGAVVIAPPHEAVAFDAPSAASLDHHLAIDGPSATAAGEVFELALKPPTGAWSTVGVVNERFAPTGGLGLTVSYRPAQLPRLWEWRMLGQGRYVVGLEPSTVGLRGRAIECADGAVAMLAPGGSRTFDLSVRVVTGRDAQALALGHSPR